MILSGRPRVPAPACVATPTIAAIPALGVSERAVAHCDDGAGL